MPEENKVIGLDQLSEYDALIKHYIQQQGGGSSYQLPIASSSQLGGIRIGDGLTINENNGKLNVDNSMIFDYKANIVGNNLSYPIKVGKVIDSYGNTKDVYASVFFNNRIGTYICDKIAIEVDDVLFYNISVNNGEFKNFREYTDSISYTPITIDGPRLFEYAGNIGLQLAIPENPVTTPPGQNDKLHRSVSAIVYYTKIDWQNELSYKPLFTSTTSKTITKGNVTISYSYNGYHGVITVNGTTGSYGDPNLDIYSEYSGATGSDVLPPIVPNAPIGSQFVAHCVTSSGYAHFGDVELFGIVDGSIKCISEASYEQTPVSPTKDQKSREAWDFVRGSTYDKPALSHIKISLLPNYTYDNFSIIPRFKTRTAYVDI